MANQAAIVGKRAPGFDLPCTSAADSGRTRVSLDDFRDRWLIVFFYPRDFSLVCPTELTALSTKFDEFERRGCDILGISVDSIESHERWMSTARSQGGLGPLRFPLASDEDTSVSRAYGVLLENQHVAQRGLFIIDPNAVLQYQAVHNLSVGRRSDDILRILAALETGGMCPEDWCADCATLDPTQLLMPGSFIGHYRIETEVGSGGFASVFRAFDTTLQRTVALKVLKPDSLPAPHAALTEARSAAALNHPNVCTVFAIDNSEGVPIIAMEYMDGPSLTRMLEQGPMSSQSAASIGCQIALGMGAAHDLGIAHGDLKPANIMLTGDGVAKITDFGLSRRLEVPGEDDDTLVGEDGSKLSGTPSYMSPEQTRGEPVTAESDVFSLGATLFEMVIGERAFTGENVLQVLNQIGNVDPDQYASRVPDPFAGILREALVRDVRDRSITMKQIAAQLTLPGDYL